MINIRSKNLGFTLIELLVVVAIIAFLAAIGIAVYSEIQSKSRDARRIADIEAIAKALELHKEGFGKYQALKNEWFIDNSELVPTMDTTGRKYCFKVNKVRANTDISWSDIDCVSSQPVTEDTPAAGEGEEVHSWTVCALLESDEKYCKSSAQ